MEYFLTTLLFSPKHMDWWQQIKCAHNAMTILAILDLEC